MAKAQQQNLQTRIQPEDVSIAILYPGNRVGKMANPLLQSRLDVAIEPPDAYERDIVLADNADRSLGVEVLKKRLHDAELIYRMRGDVFHELELWDMHPAKEWLARKVVLRNVDGCLAVSERLAEKFTHVTGNGKTGSVGMFKEVEKWPTTVHTRKELRCVTLTNAGYKKKIAPIAEWAPIVDEILADTGGYWHVCGDGRHMDWLQKQLKPYENVSYEGYVDAPEYLSKCNLMLHPSNLDGQPNSVLEGMASKMPVVTTDFAAFSRFNGPVDTVGTTEELKATLEAFVHPQDRERRGDRCMQYVTKNHSVDAIARQYEDFFTRYLHESD